MLVGHQANKRFRNMTRDNYTHVLIPKSFHSVLKAEAEKNQTSIWRFIQGLVENEYSDFYSTADNREVRRSNRRGPIPTQASSGPHTYKALRASYVDMLYLELITKIYHQFGILILHG